MFSDSKGQLSMSQKFCGQTNVLSKARWLCIMPDDVVKACSFAYCLGGTGKRCTRYIRCSEVDMNTSLLCEAERAALATKLFVSVLSNAASTVVCDVEYQLVLHLQ
jgi:hypothetical protein